MKKILLLVNKQEVADIIVLAELKELIQTRYDQALSKLKEKHKIQSDSYFHPIQIEIKGNKARIIRIA